MKRKKRVWARTATAVAFGISLGFAVLIQTSARAEESAPGEPTEQTSQMMLAAADTQPLPIAAAVNLSGLAADSSAGEDFENDPFEGFNEKMFWFNREVVDRYVLKPIATGWDFLLPDPVQRGVHNFFDNLAVVRRVVNNSLQLKFNGAATELARFGINSTIGLVGFFDVAKDGFGIEQRDEDTGQTFGVWGAGPGPYLVLPFLPPLTVRDGIGYAFDVAMTPYTYFIPWWGSIAGTLTNTVNERSLNLDRFERVAESTVDLYGAVRNAYLQRRAAAIKQ
ncbi:MAG TPA: VacJ family lipoprotein [Candidatus Binatia bacterium]